MERALAERDGGPCGGLAAGGEAWVIDRVELAGVRETGGLEGALRVGAAFCGGGGAL